MPLLFVVHPCGSVEYEIPVHSRENTIIEIMINFLFFFISLNLAYVSLAIYIGMDIAVLYIGGGGGVDTP